MNKIFFFIRKLRIQRVFHIILKKIQKCFYIKKHFELNYSIQFQFCSIWWDYVCKNNTGLFQKSWNYIMCSHVATRLCFRKVVRRLVCEIFDLMNNWFNNFSFWAISIWIIGWFAIFWWTVWEWNWKFSNVFSQICKCYFQF